MVYLYLYEVRHYPLTLTGDIVMISIKLIRSISPYSFTCTSHPHYTLAQVDKAISPYSFVCTSHFIMLWQSIFGPKSGS